MLALARLKDANDDTKIAALTELRALRTLSSYDLIQATTKTAERAGNSKIATAGRATLLAIDEHRSYVDFFGTLFRSASLGSILLVVALGLAIPFGLMGVINMAHGEMIAIGRALLTDPKLLILDEPTEGIQPSIIEQIGDTLKKLKEEGFGHDYSQEVQNAVKTLKAEGKLAILLVEQFVDFCRDCADRFYAMDRGAVVVSGPIAALTDEVVKVHLQI